MLLNDVSKSIAKRLNKYHPLIFSLVKAITVGITRINARGIVSVMVSEGISTIVDFISNNKVKKNMSSKIDAIYEETLKRKIIPFKVLQEIAEKVLGRQVS